MMQEKLELTAEELALTPCPWGVASASVRASFIMYGFLDIL